jgi:hypothetical protein
MNPRPDDLQMAMAEAIRELIKDTETQVERLRKTKEGLLARLELERRHLEMLHAKLDQISVDKHPKAEGSLAEAIVFVLREHDQPMRPSEIAQRLEENGVPTNAENGHLGNVLSTLRRRLDLFRKVARGQYELQSEAATSTESELKHINNKTRRRLSISQ